MPRTTKKIEPISLLEDSFYGDLPAILRKLADRLESHDAVASEIEIHVNDHRLRIAATVTFQGIQ